MREVAKNNTEEVGGSFTTKYSDTKEMLLDLLKVAGLISFAVLAPNALRGYSGLLKSCEWFFKDPPKVQEKKLKKTVYYLKRQGYIRIESRGKERFLRLLPKGLNKLKHLEIDNVRFPASTKWDNKWWVITADIPTKTHRSAADAFRAKLKDMNVCSLQRTLWLYPFDPTRELNFLLKNFDIGKYVTLMRVDKLDGDDSLKLKTYYKKIGLL